MRPEYLCFPLILVLLLSSCQTTPENPENSQTIESGNTQDVMIPPAPVQDAPDQVTPEPSDVAEPIIETPTEDTTLAVIPSNDQKSATELPPVKQILPSGGEKNRPAPELLTESPPGEAEPENLMEMIKSPDAEESILPLQAESQIIIEEKIIDQEPQQSKQLELPSEFASAPYNPLLPVIINPVQKDEEKVSPVQPLNENMRDSIVEKPSMNQRTDEKTIVEEQLPVVAVANNTERVMPIAPDDYTLSADSLGKLVIHLQGSGWIYLSSKGESSITLTDKSYEPETGRTRFVFVSSPEGAFSTEMVFLKQDLLRGESEQRSLTIDENTLTNPEILTEDDESTQSRPGTQDDPETVQAAPDPLSPLISETINADETGQDVISSGITPNSLVETSSVPTPIGETGFPELEFPPRGLQAAELLKQGENYEKPGPGQSLEKALMIYEMIRKDYPVTEERFIAESRIRYLNKHYFKVQ